MEIRITQHGWRSYLWELFSNKGMPIAIGSPAHGGAFFAQKQSAIAAARRMKSSIRRWCSDLTCEVCEEHFLPIYDETNRTKKVLIEGCDCSTVIPI